MRYTSRHLFTAFIGLLFSALAFAAPSFASTSTAYDTYSDHPPTSIYAISALPTDFDLTVLDLYTLPSAPSWKDRAAEYDTPVFRDLSKRTGQSYRRTRQPHVTGAPFVM